MTDSLIRPERVTRDFTIGNARFNIVTLPSSRRLQVWFKAGFPGALWEFGHSKPMPEGMAAVKAADTAADYIKGRLSLDEYNELIPPDEAAG